MDKVVTYFVLNFAGFLIFNEIWKRIKKPPPIDYTTIPGLKRPELDEDEKSIKFEPGKLIIEKSTTRGCLQDFEENVDFYEILETMKNDFGGLSSAFFGPRYIVLVSTNETFEQMKNYKNISSKVCPFAFGSVILGDPFFWQRKNVNEWEKLIQENKNLMGFIWSENQKKLVMNYPKTGKTVWKIEKQNEEDFDDFELNDLRILVFSFDEEIDIDGHQIPAFIPILVDAKYIDSQMISFMLQA
uniref:Uncharacterized protein n=1 Tax=Panagrolaimus sp. JU765 TaxID=591449 RepID=A0AC34R0Y0_9BILA